MGNRVAALDDPLLRTHAADRSSLTDRLNDEEGRQKEQKCALSHFFCYLCDKDNQLTEINDTKYVGKRVDGHFAHGGL